MTARAPIAPKPALPWYGSVAVAMFLALGVLMVVARLVGEPPPVRRREPVGAAALGLLYAAPGLAALLSRFRCRTLLAAGAALGLALVPTSFSITPLLVVPSVLLLAARRRTERSPGQAVRSALAVMGALALAGASLVVMFVEDDPMCWSYAEGPGGERRYFIEPPPPGPNHLRVTVPAGRSGGGCTSDFITPAEGATSVAMTGLWVAATAYLARGGQCDDRRPPKRSW